MSMLLLTLAAATAPLTPSAPAARTGCPELTAAQKRVAIRPLNQMPPARPELAVVRAFGGCPAVRSLPIDRQPRPR